MPAGTDNPTSPAATYPAAALADRRMGQPPGSPARGTPWRRLAPLTTLHLALAVMSFLLILPFVWMILTSFKHLSETGATTWLPGAAGWHPQNYAEVFRRIPFGRFYLNSLLVASWVTFLQVLTSAMAAFAFARLRWPGRDAVFLLYLSTMMLPGLVMMIPNFQIMISLRLVDTLGGLVLPAAFTAFGTFLLRQFMLTIPRELDEAAKIDGAGYWRLFWDVILPLARPGLITLAIFTFISNYHSFFWPLVMLRSEHNYTLPIGLLYFDADTGQQTNLLMAAVAMSIVPMIAVFVVLQKYLVRGIQLGAVKG